MTPLSALIRQRMMMHDTISSIWRTNSFVSDVQVKLENDSEITRARLPARSWHLEYSVTRKAHSRQSMSLNRESGLRARIPSIPLRFEQKKRRLLKRSSSFKAKIVLFPFCALASCSYLYQQAVPIVIYAHCVKSV